MIPCFIREDVFDSLESIKPL